MKKMPMGRRFQPGVSGNPEGGRRHDKVKRMIKKLTSKQLELVLNQILLADPVQLEKVRQENPSTLKTWIASIAVTGIKKGDASTLMILLDRLIGKVTDKVNVNSTVTGTPQVVISLPDNGRNEVK